jgi:hypothetical protein
MMERRLHARETTCRPCAISTTSDTKQGTILNMSDNGLMLLAVLDLEEGDPVQITLDDRVGNPFVITGRVARVVKTGDEPRRSQHTTALGIRLDDTPDEYLLLLSSIIFSRIQRGKKKKAAEPSEGWFHTRSSERQPHVAHCFLEGDEGVTGGTLRDLSETGIFVQTKRPARLGENLVVSIINPDGRTYLLHSTVVRSEYQPYGLDLIPDEGIGLAINFATTGYYELCDSLQG